MGDRTGLMKFPGSRCVLFFVVVYTPVGGCTQRPKEDIGLLILSMTGESGEQPGSPDYTLIVFPFL